MNVLIAEWMKARRSFVPWLVLAGALFLPVVLGLVYLFKWRVFVPADGTMGWDTLLSTCMSLSAGLLFPLVTILLVAFQHQTESRANAWKRLLVIPLGKTVLYLGKWSFLLLALLAATLIQCLGIVLVGTLLGYLFPALALPVTGLPLGYLLTYSLRLFLGFLAILTIQYVLSLLVNHSLVPVLVGVFAMVLSIVLVQG